jgi:hypothetical protein
MTIPLAAGRGGGEGFGASQPVALAKARRRRLTGRLRQSLCGADCKNDFGIAGGGMSRLSPAGINNGLKMPGIQLVGVSFQGTHAGGGFSRSVGRHPVDRGTNRGFTLCQRDDRPG